MRSAAHTPWHMHSLASGRSILLVGTLAGLLGGSVLAAMVVVEGSLARERTFWDLAMAIWAWVAGLEHYGEPTNHPWPLLLGTLVYVAASAAAGIVFAAIAFAPHAHRAA